MAGGSISNLSRIQIPIDIPYKKFGFKDTRYTVKYPVRLGFLNY